MGRFLRHINRYYYHLVTHDGGGLSSRKSARLLYTLQYHVSPARALKYAEIKSQAILTPLVDIQSPVK